MIITIINFIYLYSQLCLMIFFKIFNFYYDLFNQNFKNEALL